MLNRPGTLVAGRYQLVELIATGGQGTIWRARDQQEKREVAAKILTDQGARNAEYAVRLAREQEALVALAGTSALAVFDLCRTSDGFPCLVTELLEGRDLERHLEELEARKERLSIPRLFEILEPISETLERAHEVGIIHRDLKPANIFLRSEASGGGVRLLDFGMSRLKSRRGLTVSGTIMGSPSYIAPEVWGGNSDDLDHRIDVYSIGVILFRALTGALPFEGATVYEKFRLITTAERPSLRALRPDLPAAIDAWTARALAIDRRQRFGSTRELLRGLSAALAYTPPKREPRPVAKGLVSAWRAATSAFQKFVDTKVVPGHGHREVPPPAINVDALSALDALNDDKPPEPRPRPRSKWTELADADVVYEPGPSSVPAAPRVVATPASVREAAPGAKRTATPDAKVRGPNEPAVSPEEARAMRRAAKRKRAKERRKEQRSKGG